MRTLGHAISNNLLYALAGCVVALQCSCLYSADVFIGTPGTGSEGFTYALEPFALEDLGVPSIRYQQVYDSSEFLRDIPNGGLINGLVFRVDSGMGRGGGAAYPAVQIDMAVTDRDPDQLSTVFTENIGSQALTVYPKGFFEIGFPGPGFLITSPITLQTPFHYNPADGNLLLDIRIFSQTLPPHDPNDTAGPMDAENNLFGPDTVSRVFAYDVNATSGTADSIGLITFFRVTPIPEPSTTALLLLAIIGIAVLRSRGILEKLNR